MLRSGRRSKVIKFGKPFTFLLISAILAVATYSTWRDLIWPNAPLSTNKDSLEFFFRLGDSERINIGLGAMYEPAADSDAGGEHQVADALLTISTRGTSTGVNKYAYIGASPELAAALDYCSENSLGKGVQNYVDGSIERISWADFPGDLKGILAASPDRVYYRYELALTRQLVFGCTLLSSALWYQDGPHHIMQTPSLEMVIKRPGVESYQSDPSLRTSPDSGDSKYCVSLDVNYGNGVSVDAQFPRPNRYLANGSEVYDCQVQQPDNTVSQEVYLEPGSLALTNLIEDAQESRNQFFAGAFVGALGGLAIEIVGGVYDTVEGWLLKYRKRKRSPTPRQSRWFRRWGSRRVHASPAGSDSVSLPHRPTNIRRKRVTFNQR
jgi:hypothetical protein